MLTQLTINNFAIVRQLEIELAKGMSVITGETGAGKSIAIDALGLCLGQRIETSMVREGQERAEICATFFIEPTNPAYQWLQEQELQDPDNPSDCILRRVINADGRSKAFINSTPVSASQLKEIGQYLIHINGQHASQLLLKNDYQLQLVDIAHVSARWSTAQCCLRQLIILWYALHPSYMALSHRKSHQKEPKP